jgi:hypothetical protein
MVIARASSASVLVVGVLAVAGLTVGLGEGPYQAIDHDLVYNASNDYLLYFVDGSDTLGGPVSTELTEVHTFFPAVSGLDLTVRLEGDGVESESRFGIGFDGRVETIDGRSIDEVSSPRVDVLPRIPLPAGSLKAGARWIDSVAVADTATYGKREWYRVVREYEVVGDVDLEGQTVVLIVSEGTVSLRQGGLHPDNAQNRWFQEVSGLVVDSVWFDATSGTLIQDATRMRLTGFGQLFASDVCCGRSGLVSTSRRSVVDPLGGPPNRR